MMMIQNEAEVGQALKDSGVPREDVWITSKVLLYRLNN
jgi:diketogulonate reductase-like aldo/keto reductase